MSTRRLSLTMNTLKLSKHPALAETPSTRANRLAVWILLALGLLLMLVSVGKAEQPSAQRVDRFNGTLAAGQTIQVENVSGDITATAGKAFSATVTVTVYATTQKKAEEVLGKTTITNSHDDDGWSLETTLPEGRPFRGNRHGLPCDGCRIVARYEIVVPPGAAAELKTVNGDVRVNNCDGELHLEAVNGSIEAHGVKQSLEAQTVNGKIDATMLALPADASVALQSVNGNVVLTLPREAKFELAASTMNGTIASTFALPPRAGDAAGHKSGKGGKTPKADRGDGSRQIVIDGEDGETTVVDLHELERELENSMKGVDLSIEEDMREANESVRQARETLRQIRIADPRREYSGSIGKDGADVRMETLNGAVLVLAAGTKEADAKTLVSERRTFVVTVPRVQVNVRTGKMAPLPPVPPVPPVPPAPLAPRAPRAVPPVPPVPTTEIDNEIVRGDISGDFLSTSTEATYRIGKVSGRARILTHSGEIRVGGAGAGADLKTFGGDIVIGPVTGDLKASTMAGEIRAGAVSGSALADTAGGDIVIERVGGNLDAKTAGGDIVALSVGGAVRAATAGGDVRIGIASREAKGGITIHNSGGDVSLTLPGDYKADIELIVTGTDDDDEQAIRSDFPNLSIAKRSGSQRATLSLNGGGEKVVVRTTSGTIRLKKTASS
jgi:DUF4097 and DUF4098 domain-containing protein YvlB